MPAIAPTTGVDGVIAGGNTPAWIVQEATVTMPLIDSATSFPLAALSDDSTVKVDCHMDMDGLSFTRTATTKDRQRMCEKIKRTVKTGETIDGTLTAVYDQQADAADIINAAYTALPEESRVYVVQAYGLDSHQTPTATTKVDVYRVEVQQRNKNTPVAEEDLMFTATLSADLYLPDVNLSA